MCATPVWSNGGRFFQSAEIKGQPEFVFFGNVKDDHGRYLKDVVVRVRVPEHMLEYTTETDLLGRYRTADIGRVIKDLGYQVDPSMITISVEYPEYGELRREARGKYQQNQGALEINFILQQAAR